MRLQVMLILVLQLAFADYGVSVSYFSHRVPSYAERECVHTSIGETNALLS